MAEATARNSEEKTGIDLEEGGYAGINRIMVCLDGSSFGEAGLDYALPVAKACHAELHLFHVVEETPHPYHRVPIDTLGIEISKTKAMQYLEELKRKALKAEVPVTVSIASGNAPDNIFRMIEAERIDLVVLSSHGKNGNNAWPLSGTAFKIVNKVRISLLLVPAGFTGKRTEPLQLKRILVFLDASVRSECVLPLVRELACANQSELLIAHVTPTYQMTASQPLCHMDQKLLKQFQDRNYSLAQSYIRGIGARMSDAGIADVRTLVTQALDLRQEILNLTEREAVDLVLLSAHGQTANPALPHGSVTQHLLTYGTTPVLVLQDLCERE